MTLAKTVQDCLNDHNAHYDVHPHHRTATTFRSATAAHVPLQQLAKAVVLRDDNGYLMAVLPGDRYVRVRWLRQATGRPVKFATEQELGQLLADCELGAIPPLGEAYGMDTIVDDALTDLSEVYFEAGTHEDLVHMNMREFMDLQPTARHMPFSVSG